jgi:TusE/DsrC/DsvC family sulfur relay protein
VLARGHGIYRVFFYNDGVYNANRLSEPQSDDRNLVRLWSKLGTENNIDLVALIARSEDIEMADDHWEVVNFLRNYYQEYQIAPAVRVLIKAIRKTLGPEKGSSRYLYQLFPYGPARQGCKIAGLPKPTSCI